MKKVILCVDDERIILSSLKSQLKKNFGSQFQYEFAENAYEAMDLVLVCAKNEALGRVTIEAMLYNKLDLFLLF